MKMRLTMPGDAPSALSVAMFDCFSIMSIDMVDTTLNEAMARMNASMANVIHFSMAIMRNDCSCCCRRLSTL